MVVRGDMQVEGIDYTEKHAPVVSWGTIRTILTMSLHYHWETMQIDFSNAFTQATLKNPVYVSLPPCFMNKRGDRKTILKLEKALYGLVQAPLEWYEHLRDQLQDSGEFKNVKISRNDPCLFFIDECILIIYVDDVLGFSKNKSNLKVIFNKLKKKGMIFTEESEENDVFSFLGIEIRKSEDGKRVEMLQKGLIEKVIKRWDW